MGEEKVSLAEFAYHRLLTMIKTGELAPGQRLRELDLVDLLGISRTPVRDAMRRLRSEGLVTITDGNGASVTRLSRQQVRELYSLRAVLEGAAARLAAQHASLSEISALQDLLEEAKLARSSELLAKMNLLFHKTIRESAHNTYLSSALDQLALHLSLLPGTTFEVEGRDEQAHAEHKAIYDAIVDRDPDAAEAAARHHIEKSGLVRLRMMFSAAEQ